MGLASYLFIIMKSIIMWESLMILASAMPLFFNRERPSNTANALASLLDLQLSLDMV